MSVDISKKLLENIITLCDDIAFARKAVADELHAYTVGEDIPKEVARLAEAFAFMLVKLDIREEHAKRLIAELIEKNAEIEAIKKRVEQENAKLMGIVQSDNKAKNLIGQSEAIKSAIKTAKAVALRPVNTMLLGETGTGKEKFAKLIHFSSQRCKGPFVAINCSAIPDTLFESEFFGIEKGVATGVLQKKGLLEEAHGGTLFLDELTDMPLGHQAKLLRVLEEQEVVRVGSTKPIPIDVKIISAANIDIEEALEQKKLRLDLFYRLNVAEIHIAPLRERGEDILILATHFLKKHCLHMQQRELVLLPKAREALMAYPWPGNVRELNNEMERAVALAIDKHIDLHDLSPKIAKYAQAVPSPAPLSKNRESQQSFENSIQGESLNLAELESKCIVAALKQSNGNKTKAANLLGITREGLRKKILRLDLNVRSTK